MPRGRRHERVVEQPASGPTARPADVPAIELVDVHKRFEDEVVLAGAHLTVRRGTTVVLLGASGSGKSVLLKLVIGLLRPDRGIVRVDGQDLATLSGDGLDELHRKMGILFQSGALFDGLTAYENLAFPLRERTGLDEAQIGARVEATLELVGLSDAASVRPGDLSGGMRKRLGFARALVLQPEILLFDEPTAGLDPLNTQTVADEIRLVQRELPVTILAITHDLPTAFRIGTEVALLHEGRLLGPLPPEDFLHSPHPAIHRFVHLWEETQAQGRGAFEEPRP